jgi:hypothetical protein
MNTMAKRKTKAQLDLAAKPTAGGSQHAACIIP